MITLIVLTNDRLLKHFYEFNLLFFLAFVNDFWVNFSVCLDIVTLQDAVNGSRGNLELTGDVSNGHFFFQITYNNLFFFGF